jgi:hypothetical protein
MATRNRVTTVNAPMPSGHCVRATIHGDLVFIFSQLPTGSGAPDMHLTDFVNLSLELSHLERPTTSSHAIAPERVCRS